ncbi:unnamed protein product [Thelazia callipaeda]|uniref:Ribosomal RNA-processing protein 42 n=1 Tax=Thelazia callipaeda TaxID=103827 RepID=A0A0N5DA02_THECL|nr:unnamed protein product [Thelazia callipaeda]
MELRLSEAEKVFIVHGAQEGLRSDGRGPLDYRPIIVQTGVLPTTNGSARVRIGSTDLLIGIKADLVTVQNTAFCRNRLNFFVDCSANATPLFAGRGGEEFADELSAALDAAFDNDYVVPDLKKLILSPMHMWRLFVDIVILQCDGNVIDAAGLGIKAALGNTEICEVLVRPADAGKFMIDLPKKYKLWKFDVSRVPLFVSVNRVGTAKIVDNSLAEESCTCTSIWLAGFLHSNSSNTFEEDDQSRETYDDCMITYMRQCGGGTFEMDSLVLEEMINIGLKVVRQLHVALNRRLLNEDQVAENSLSTFLQ